MYIYIIAILSPSLIGTVCSLGSVDGDHSGTSQHYFAVDNMCLEPHVFFVFF